MLTEYEVRLRVEQLESSPEAPMRKVRSILRIAGVLKRQERALVHARALTAQAKDCNTASHLDRMIRSLRMLYEDVRLAAVRILREMNAQRKPVLALA